MEHLENEPVEKAWRDLIGQCTERSPYFCRMYLTRDPLGWKVDQLRVQFCPFCGMKLP